MKEYTILDQDCEWRELYEAVNETNTNLNDTDKLYMSSMSNGQIYTNSNDKYYVNNQEATRGTNIVIAKEDIGNFRIYGFKIYYRKLNKIYNIDIDVNLDDYKDNRVHFLYIVLTGEHGAFEIKDSVLENTETSMLFARFVIATDGTAKQFYVICPFAGSPDYIKGNTFYQVSNGFNLEVVSETLKTFTIQDSEIQFSGINFENYMSPDVLPVRATTSLTFRYVEYDDGEYITNWDSVIQTPIKNKIINYTSGVETTVDENKFTIQKVYYDYLTKVFVALKGNAQYDTMKDATTNINTIFNYPLPDGIRYMLPIAAIIIKNSDEQYSDETLKIVGLKYDENELFDANEIAIEQSEKAIEIVNQFVSQQTSINEGLRGDLDDHTNATINATTRVHGVKLASTSEATTGTSNDTLMTPATTVSSVNNYVRNNIIDANNIKIVVSDEEPQVESGKTILWINTDE